MDVTLADVKPSVLSWVIVTLMAVTGIVLLKWAMSKWPVKGLSDIIKAV